MLPVQTIYADLVDQLHSQPVTLLQAPPGAGKSTWLPLQLVRDKHFKRIIMLEPRRLAARNIAHFLASCQQEPLGQSIGLRIRNEQYVSAQTQLEIVTEGVLTRMLQQDPELSGVDCLIFDEFHERSLAADTALAFALESQAALRDDLTILIMSATLDADHIAEQLNCRLIQSEGRSYPIVERYVTLKDESNWLFEMPAIIKQAISEESGSCLVFLPGQREITYLNQQLMDLPPDIEVFTLFGDQNKREQQAAIAPAPSGKRKVVLTTNVAETSLTIEGIRIVIDSGRKRAAQFNIKTGVTELVTAQISRSSAVQRAGRAGRLEPGVVYRLGSLAQFERRDAHDKPEILISDISQLLLEASLWGCDIAELTLLDSPSLIAQQQAWQVLIMLEAVDEQHKITPFGRQMLSFGTDLRLAHMLLKAQALQAEEPQLLPLAIYLVALLESRVSKHPDLAFALQNKHYLTHPQFKLSLKMWLKRFGLKPSELLQTEDLGLLVAMAFPDRMAKRRGQGYQLANGAGADVIEGHWHKDEYLAIAELGGHKGQRIFSAVPVAIGQLQTYLPHLFQRCDVCEFDEKAQRFIAESRLMLGALVIERKDNKTNLDESLRTQAWLNLVVKHGLNLFAEYSNCQQLLIRMELAAKYFPDSFSQCSDAYLTRHLSVWLAPYLANISTFAQLKKIALFEILSNMLDWESQHQLKQLFPTKVKVPSGSTIGLEYQLDGPATLSVRMQEVYGWMQSPEVAKGKVPVLMALLSPAGRPLQLTQDLAGFWQGSYKEVQKEMKGRYPKHFWPDDPATSVATNRVKSRM